MTLTLRLLPLLLAGVLLYGLTQVIGPHCRVLVVMGWDIGKGVGLVILLGAVAYLTRLAVFGSRDELTSMLRQLLRM